MRIVILSTLLHLFSGRRLTLEERFYLFQE